MCSVDITKFQLAVVRKGLGDKELLFYAEPVTKVIYDKAAGVSESM